MSSNFVLVPFANFIKWVLINFPTIFAIKMLATIVKTLGLSQIHLNT